MIDLEYLRLLRGFVLMLSLGMIVLFAFLAAWWQERKGRLQGKGMTIEDGLPAGANAVAADAERRNAELQPARRADQPSIAASRRAA